MKIRSSLEEFKKKTLANSSWGFPLSHGDWGKGKSAKIACAESPDKTDLVVTVLEQLTRNHKGQSDMKISLDEMKGQRCQTEIADTN